MNDMEGTNVTTEKSAARRWRAAGLVTAGVIAGGVLAGTLSANAATTTPTPTPSASSSTGSDSDADRGGHPSDGPASVRSDETVLTGADADKAKAAALVAVPGGTVIRVESDAGDGVYEAHMTKADGTRVTVKFDKNLVVTSVQDGMGKGDPHPAGAENSSNSVPAASGSTG